MTRWIFHIVTREAYDAFRATGAREYAPPSLATEGFVHCSYRDEVAESARRYFPPGAALVVLRIDPRRLAAPLHVAATPRGPMPHVHGPINADAIVDALAPDAVARAEEWVA